ncbi:MAG: hydantoinase B/oxoprolinase family protein [Phycisphaeraceae bacterium]
MPTSRKKPTSASSPVPSDPPAIAGSWQFWIDVGGTFTDCIGRKPDGSIVSCKVLSSGVIKGRTADGTRGRRIIDPRRVVMPQDFFRGYTFSLLDDAGELLSQGIIEASTPAKGELTLTERLHPRAQPEMNYQLESGEPAPVVGMRTLMGLRLDEPIVPQGGTPVRVRLGTTKGTNALLERKGARIALVTTQGFGDLPEIGTQARPELFKLRIVKPLLLHEKVVELAERIDAAGNIIQPLDPKDVEKTLRGLLDEEIDAIAVCFLNSYVNPAHERLVAEMALKLGFDQVSVSSVLSPTIKMLDRCDTALVDAYLSPVIRDYGQAVTTKMPKGSLKLMTSAGGLAALEQFSGKDSILSGPAGGVVGFAHAAKEAGYLQAIGFDMGGTSTDVARFGGEYEYQFTAEKAGVRIVAPMYAIETVAAGGGSICRFDGQRLTVGPDSAGSEPGPACYGRGGPLTITDINLYTGRVDASRFPFPLDREVVEAKLDELAEKMSLSSMVIAEGFLRIADETMAAAIKRISVAKGYDPREHVLVAFGSAGAQHACAIARILGIRTILLHPMAGVLSAYGLGMADVRRFAEQSVLKTYSEETLAELHAHLVPIEARLRSEVEAEDIAGDRIHAVHLLDLRYRGEESTITVRQPDDGDYAKAFADMHQQLYGHVHEGRDVEIVTMRVEMVGETSKPATRISAVTPREPLASSRSRTLFEGREHDTPVYRREDLQPGDTFQGPALVTEPFSTIVLDLDWRGEVSERGDLVLKEGVNASGGSAGASPSQLPTHATRDPVLLELFNNHFTSIAVQMGVTLQRTSLSVNVKERLDFSCAVLDAQGHLVVNAPHIPVHLGAMSECVKSLIKHVKGIRPGDVYACNDPDLGGSHLPDVTIITPVFDPSGKELRFFTASRAHHAEIGGVRPGSLYPFAKNLAEEGVVLRNLLIARGGEFHEKSLRDALLSGPYPSRAPEDNIADIRAAVAANHIGLRELGRMIEHYTWPVVSSYMKHIRDAAEEKVRAAIAKLPQGKHAFADGLDDGSPVRVKITIKSDQMIIDFTGTAPVSATSINANPAIVQAAVLYCLRCLIDEDIPLNSGVLAPVKLIIPKGSMLSPPVEPDPAKHAAVVGGNVELSQRIVDVILGALGVAAASQGTMNNFTFGNERFGYYETIAGGSGAVEGFDGAAAVHTHMTNTRITDVEVLERRYPVRLRAFRVRHGSGGEGKWWGGDGITRVFEFLEPVEVSLLTQRRETQPFGLQGGQPGHAGANLLWRKGAVTEITLEELAQFRAEVGDVLTISTPGGGGFGT